MKYKITFKEKVTLFWNDPEDLDGYSLNNERDYYPKTYWKPKADSMIVEIIKVSDGLIVKEGSRRARFSKVHEKCIVEEIKTYDI